MSLVTGTVQLSLAEVDNLRDQIKDGKAKIKEIEKKLVEVKADKRVMKITKKILGGKNDYKITIDPRLFTSLENYEKDQMESFRHYHRNSFPSKEEKVIAAIKLEPIQYTIAESGYSAAWQYDFMLGKTNLSDEVDFVNMDDVKQEIRSQIEGQFKDELTTLRNSSQNYHDDSVRMVKRHNKELEDLKEIIAKKDKAYEDLLMDKQEKSEIASLQEQIKKLNEDLEKEINKPWYKKLVK